MRSGYLALILHAHLPFVRHPEQEHFLEEDWLFEAITETYIPLLRMMQRLANDGVPFKLAMSITPTLCAMLQDELLRERYVRHLDLLIDLAAREQKRNRKHPRLRELAEFYSDLFFETRCFFVEQWKCDLLASFHDLHAAGALEITGCAATHGLLSLIQRQSREAARAQILIGRDVYLDLFGVDPTGFWLPECAYAPGLESLLQEANIRWFVLDAHGVMFGKPRPCRSIYAPSYTPAGPAVFARDRDSSRQVWSAQEGYPGHPGRGEEKELYDREGAEKAVEMHAAHFVEQRQMQLRELRGLGFDPIIVAPFDAELFGHWWFEGPRFLELVIRKAAREQGFRLTTPSDYLAAHSTQQTIQPAASTWGENGYLGVWLDQRNAWIYPHLHTATQRMSEAARRHAGDSSPLADRVLKQLARELLLAQSSDWAFLMKTGTAKEYATQRTLDHLSRFNRLHDQFTANHVDEKFLHDCEWRDNLFPNVNWRYYI